MTEGGREREERISVFTVSFAGARETILCSSNAQVTHVCQRRASISQLKIMFFHFCVSRHSGTESQFPRLCGEDAHFKDGLVFIFSGMRLVWAHNAFKLCL